MQILLGDKQQIFLDGLTCMLTHSPTFQVVGQAENGKEIVDLARELEPDAEAVLRKQREEVKFGVDVLSNIEQPSTEQESDKE